MKKHIELREDVVEDIKKFKKRINRPSLFKTINDSLDFVKTKMDYPYFDFVSKSSVCYVKPYYLFYGEEIIGQFNVEVRKQVITFLHEDKEYSFSWEDMKDNITGLSSIIIAYATSYEEFEKLLKLYDRI